MVLHIPFTANCGYPSPATTVDSIRVMGHTDPALEATVVTFSCSPGLVLTGPNTTTCMDNGQWEPNPREVKCKGISNVQPVLITSCANCYHCSLILILFYSCTQQTVVFCLLL